MKKLLTNPELVNNLGTSGNCSSAAIFIPRKCLSHPWATLACNCKLCIDSIELSNKQLRIRIFKKFLFKIPLMRGSYAQ